MKSRLPVCPYCHQILGLAVTKENIKQTKGNIQCPKCKKYFGYKKEIEVVFITKKIMQPEVNHE